MIIYKTNTFNPENHLMASWNQLMMNYRNNFNLENHFMGLADGTRTNNLVEKVNDAEANHNWNGCKGNT